MLNMDGVLFNESRIEMRHVSDGLSNTMLLGEAVPDTTPSKVREPGQGTQKDHWYIGSDDIDISNDFSEFMGSTGVAMNLQNSVPRDKTGLSDAVIQELQLSFGSAHPGSFNAVMCDGSVRHVNYNIDKTTFRRVGNRLDGNALADF